MRQRDGAPNASNTTRLLWLRNRLWSLSQFVFRLAIYLFLACAPWPARASLGQTRAGQTRPGRAGPGQASAALFLLPARLKLITGHKSWPAYQRQRQRQQQQSWPDPQLATGCHAMTITSCSSYSHSHNCSSRLLIRATCHACQRGQGCVLLPLAGAASSR